MAKQPKSAKSTALDYLSYRSRTSQELRDHLTKKGYPEDEIQKVLHDLEDSGLIGDEVFCRYYILSSMDQGRGPVRIRRELAGKGVTGSMVQDLLEQLYPATEELQIALKQAAKILSDSKGRPLDKTSEGREAYAKDLSRMVRRLAALGFQSKTIYQVLGMYRKGIPTLEEFDLDYNTGLECTVDRNRKKV